MNGLTIFMATVGWAFCAFVVFAFIFVLMNSWRDSFKKSEKYKRKQRDKARKKEYRRVEDMFNSGYITNHEATQRLDAIVRQEKADAGS